MIPQGYRIILLEQIVPEWDEELRIPLIIRAMAQDYDRPENEFVIGLQDLETLEIEVTTMNTNEIDQAYLMGKQLASIVKTELEQYQQ